MASPTTAGNYYDILLIGSTGMGRSSTGNKLVANRTKQTSAEDASGRTTGPLDVTDTAQESERNQIGLGVPQQQPVDATGAKPLELGKSSEAKVANCAGKEGTFQVGDVTVSKTKECHVNDCSLVTVVDTPGLADTNKTKPPINSGDAAQSTESMKENVTGCKAAQLRDVSDTAQESEKTFEVGDGTASITNKCHVICNDCSLVRVVDTPGLAHTIRTKKFGVLEGNLQVVRSILRIQQDLNLNFRRILYFLPARGPFTRAGGVLQEEIKVLHGFFGESIFNVMVIIATYDKEDSDSLTFNKAKIDKTAAAFMDASTAITGVILPKCPPILYLPFSESDILDKVKSAEVIDDKPLETLVIEGRCIKCAAKLVFDNETKQITHIVTERGKEIPVEETKCHPFFIAKYSYLQKCAGGVAHLITKPLVLWGAMTEVKLPKYSNQEEICICCKKPPGEKGCLQYGDTIIVEEKINNENINDESIEHYEVPTDHSTKLNVYKRHTIVNRA